MKRTLLLSLAALLLAVTGAMAQAVIVSPAVSSTQLEFTHDAVNTDGYAIFIDGARSVPTVTRVGTTTEYRTAFPQGLTTGTHTIEFTAFITVDGIQYDSAKSDTLSVRIVNLPGKPGQPRIILLPTSK